MSFDQKPATKSPLKDQPLRVPGQSTDERRHDLVFDRMLPPFLVLLAFGAVAFIEFWGWLTKSPRGSAVVIYGVTALGALVFCVIRWRRCKREVANLRLGRDGERAVAEELVTLTRKGCAVYHDIVGPSFNLDHVIVAAQGVYVVETKTISKPTRPDAFVTFDGTSVRIDGHKPDRDPIEQVLAQIAWLRDLLKQSTGSDVPVKGVVVFPGWFVKSNHSNADRKVWVMNPKGVDGFISAGHLMLSPDQMHMVAFHLSRFIRSSQS